MMMVLSGGLCCLMIVVVVVCLLFQRHSLFGVLLSLKVFGLVLFFWFMVFFGSMQSLVGFGLVYLCLEVCVMCVSLVLMVQLISGAGSDYVGVVAVVCL
uniref:NADH dehydrogenase subunit 4L n=1 Tax=Quadrula quadrula TaxID=52372 RepID=D2DW00_QUAQU|nr:NADH dehydrogenase subunit 4L [Quadrula quadrula]